MSPPDADRRGYGTIARADEASDGDGDGAQSMRWLPVVLVLITTGIDMLAQAMVVAPQTRLLEDILCREHFAGVAAVPSEDMCKIPPVQDGVARLLGWQVFFEGIPSLLLAMHFGALADRLGRRPVLVLSKIGQVLATGWTLLVAGAGLDLKLRWLSGVFLVIGGGGTVQGAVCMMIFTDVVSEEKRSRFLMQAKTVAIAADLVGPVLASVLMRGSPWPPLLLALSLTVGTTLLACIIPETRPQKTQAAVGDSSSDSDSSAGPPRSLREHVAASLACIAGHRSVLLLVLCSVVSDYARQSLSILVQYVSTRYHVSLEKASLFLSFRSLCQLATLAVILPTLDALVVRRFRTSLSSPAKDLWFARGSLGCIVLSFAILAWAPSMAFVAVALVMYTLGSGLSSLNVALLAALVEKTMMGTILTALAVMDTVGALLAGPIVAQTFSWSLDLDDAWRGIPFIVSLVFCSVAMAALSRVRV